MPLLLLFVVGSGGVRVVFAGLVGVGGTFVVENYDLFMYILSVECGIYG